MQVAGILIYITPDDFHSGKFHYIGQKAVEELRRKLPSGAVARDSRMHLQQCIQRIGYELRMEVFYEDPNLMMPSAQMQSYYPSSNLT